MHLGDHIAIVLLHGVVEIGTHFRISLVLHIPLRMIVRIHRCGQLIELFLGSIEFLLRSTLGYKHRVVLLLELAEGLDCVFGFQALALGAQNVDFLPGCQAFGKVEIRYAVGKEGGCRLGDTCCGDLHALPDHEVQAGPLGAFPHLFISRFPFVPFRGVSFDERSDSAGNGMEETGC